MPFLRFFIFHNLFLFNYLWTMRLRSLLQNLRWLFGIYILAGVFTGLQLYFNTLNSTDQTYTLYNNYIIFKQSFFHLLNGSDLYALYPEEHWDYYKYSPAFALFFGIFAYLPDWLGLILWNLANALPLFFAVKNFKGISNYHKSLALLFMLPEVFTSLQNTQSNALIAGLIIAGYNQYEKENYFTAALWIICSGFIKIYSLAALVLFIFRPRSYFKLAGYSIIVFLALTFIPLCLVSNNTLIFLYDSWFALIGSDHDASTGISVMGWLQTWFGIYADKNMVALTGIILFLLPLLRFKQYGEEKFRKLILCSVLIWMVIFNHKAESPTFIIAVAGAALWLFDRNRWNAWYISLALLVFLFTCLAPTDIYPPALRQKFFEPYVVKVVPCILVWILIQKEALFKKEESETA